MNYLNFFVILICIILFSCTDRFNFAHYNDIKVVRTTRDSTYYKDGLLFSGFVRKYVDNKKLLSFSLDEGKIDGEYVEYYYNGYLKNISNFKNGELEGKFLSYYDNNVLMEEINYQNGLMEGERILYWNNGNVKEKNILKKGAIIGKSEFYYANGSLRKIISFDINGRRDGDWIDYYPDGEIKLKVVYVSGKVLNNVSH